MRRLAAISCVLGVLSTSGAIAHEKSRTRYAIRLAAQTFHLSERGMLRVALCETGGTLDPRSYNRASGAAGLFQWLPATWESQGMRGFSVFDPFANAMATARLVAREGWRQWSCQP
jgi:hypothetical protein